MMVSEIIRIINTKDAPQHLRRAGQRLLQAWLAFGRNPSAATKLMVDRRLAWFERVARSRINPK